VAYDDHRRGAPGSPHPQPSSPPLPSSPLLAEHATFIAGLKSCGRDWKRISLMIPTRTVVQIRTHAQKFFAKLQKVREG
jgi:SHAQKYF class myb-like DNA-binding protein